MRRVELNIRRLVVHGPDPFDTSAFSDALRQEVAERLGEGRKIGQSQPNAADPPIRTSASPAVHVASAVAGRMFK
jgi:hypothetical protein